MNEKEIYSSLKLIDDIEEWLSQTAIKARKASSIALINGDNNRACGMAGVAEWLDELSSDLGFNPDDD